MSKNAELRKQLTDAIIRAIEDNDVLPWRRPWAVSKNVGLPRNVVSKRLYSGINPLSLEVHRMNYGFNSKWYGTYRQWEQIGGNVQRRPSGVKPGEWGARIVFYKPIARTTTDAATGEEKEDRFFLMKSATVFNADQVQGVESWQSGGDIEAGEWEADFGPAEELIRKSGIELRHGGESAYYKLPVGEWPNHIDGDYIVMPDKSRFDPPGSYYETIFHELAHSFEVRTNWNREEEGYAASELVAELTSSYVSTELGIPHGESLENHAAYLKGWGWLDKMKADPSFLFKASSQASKVTDYLLSFVQQPVLEEVADAA
jgi:antirestriction protein ArdC